MKNILARANLEMLRQYAWSKVMLAFDFDGTLAPIVPRPDRAAMRLTTSRLLAELVKRYPCVVISGRARRDVARRLRGVGVQGVVGNHGVEPWHSTGKLEEEVRRWQPLLQERLAGLHGVMIEDKGFSVAVHFRQSRQKKLARGAILEAARSLGEVRLIGGKQVVNILPDGAPHKGGALERERARLGCDTAIYVGDDDTDEDVFVLDQPGQLLAIRVGRQPASAAAYFIPGQRDMDELLRVLLHLRQEAGLAPSSLRSR